MMSCFLVVFFVQQVKDTGSCYLLRALRDPLWDLLEAKDGGWKTCVAALPVHNSSMSMFNIDIQTISFQYRNSN